MNNTINTTNAVPKTTVAISYGGMPGGGGGDLDTTASVVTGTEGFNIVDA